jgi:hypothetical protein
VVSILTLVEKITRARHIECDCGEVHGADVIMLSIMVIFVLL